MKTLLTIQGEWFEKERRN